MSVDRQAKAVKCLLIPPLDVIFVPQRILLQAIILQELLQRHAAMPRMRLSNAGIATER